MTRGIIGRAKLRLAPKIIIPSTNELSLRCGACGGMTFAIHVIAIRNGDYARVTGIVCDPVAGGCGRVRKLTPGGVLEDIRERGERETLKGKSNGTQPGAG